MHKLLLTFLVLSSFTAWAQSEQKPQPRQYLIRAAGLGPFEKGEILNESPLLPVQKLDSFVITPQVEKEGHKNFFLRGLLKTIGAGLFAYKAKKTVDGKRETRANGIGLLLGVGLAAGAPDYIRAVRGKQDPQVFLSLYDKEKS